MFRVRSRGISKKISRATRVGLAGHDGRNAASDQRRDFGRSTAGVKPPPDALLRSRRSASASCQATGVEAAGIGRAGLLGLLGLLGSGPADWPLDTAGQAAQSPAIAIVARMTVSRSNMIVAPNCRL